MLPKSQRLPRSLRLSSARFLRTELFSVKSLPNSLGTPRFGVVISKKIDKRAVARNRMRRLIHKTISMDLVQLAGSHDVLFVIQKPFKSIPEDLIHKTALFLGKV